METLLMLAMMVAMLYWTGLFWWRVGLWVYLHGRTQRDKARETYQRLVRVKDAALNALREEL